MSRHASRFNKRDANERLILAALAKMGIDWHEAGPLDGWVYIGEWVPIEIKTPQGTLTESQREFIAQCQHRARPYLVWRSVEDALSAVGA